MSAALGPVNVTELIDQRPLGTYQFVIIGICTFVALMDGFRFAGGGCRRTDDHGGISSPAGAIGRGVFELILGVSVWGTDRRAVRRPLGAQAAADRIDHPVYALHDHHPAGEPIFQVCWLFAHLPGSGLAPLRPALSASQPNMCRGGCARG